MFVMMNEPLADWTADEVRAYFSDKDTEEDLVLAYAVTHNKFWWLAIHLDEYEEDTPEFETADALTNEWGDLMEEYENRIFDILISEGVTIPKTGQIVVLRPFMERYGYEDRNGWWVKSNNTGDETTT